MAGAKAAVAASIATAIQLYVILPPIQLFFT